MSYFSKTHLTAGAKPVRRRATVLLRRDKKTGEEIEVLLEGQETILSSDGSPDTVTLQTLTFHDCGHSTDLPAAGECLCGATSCESCHGNCAAPDCGRPLCRECSRFMARRDEPEARFCQACFEKIQRGRWIRSFLLFLISPFVTGEKGSRS